MSRQKAAAVSVGDVGGAEEGGGGRGRETFYSLLRQSSSAMKNAWKHQSGTQLFAWLRGLKQRMQPSLTQALRMLQQYNRA